MKKVRYTVFLHPDLSSLLEERAKAELADPQELVRRILGDHLLDKCGVVKTTAVVKDEGDGRGRGRPKGGSKEHEATYESIMKGDPATCARALAACGFFPTEEEEGVEASWMERITGNPFSPAPAQSLMEEPTQAMFHRIRVSKLNPDELEYVQVMRTYNTPEDGHNSDSESVRTSTRNELWNMVKKGL